MFKPQFAPLVKSGVKRQTIRPYPKRMPKVGDRESWREWSGKPYRSKQIELAQVELTEVSPITITGKVISICGISVSTTDEHLLAVADGFSHANAMKYFFDTTHGLPFRGIVIKAK